MPDINWGGDSTTAPYSSRYDGSAGDLVLVEDKNAGTVLLEWDGTTYQYRGPVQMNGEDVTGVGALESQSVSTDDLNNIHVAPTPEESSDIGAEIQSIHDNKATDGDGIFIPPGDYANQQTPIDLTKYVALYSTGAWKTPGATIRKQADITQLSTAYQASGDRGNDGHHVSGIRFSGVDVADSSTGVRLQSTVTGSFETDNHGLHGVTFETSTDLHSTNWSDAAILTRSNSQKGLYVADTGGTAINLNAMDIRAHAQQNGGIGVHNRDGYGTNWRGDAANNGQGWLLEDQSSGRGRHLGKIRAEANTNPSEVTAPNSALEVTTPLSDWDFSTKPASSVVKKGREWWGQFQVKSRDGAPALQLYRDGTKRGQWIVDGSNNVVETVAGPQRSTIVSGDNYEWFVGFRSDAPGTTQSNAVYLDDGTNTGDGSPGFRVTTDGGASWTDL